MYSPSRPFLQSNGMNDSLNYSGDMRKNNNQSTADRSYQKQSSSKPNFKRKAQ